MALPKRPSPNGKFAGSVKMGEKGQIVIPKEVRDLLGIGPGDTLLVLCDKKRGMAIPTVAQSKKIYSQIFGTMDATEEDDAP